MDEFEKIRAFSEQMSQRTEQALKQETEESEGQVAEENPDFLREWSHQDVAEQAMPRSFKKAFWGVLILTTAVVLSLGFVIYLLLRDPMENREEVPIIAPTPVPVKIKPQNPGGMVIPDQDKVIYDRISQDPVPVKVEKLFPDEEPVLPLVEENIEMAEAEDIVVPVFVEDDSEMIVEPPIEKKEIKQEDNQTVKNEEKLEMKIESQKEVVPSKEEIKKVPVAQEIWHAQLFSSTDKNKVEKIWNTILSKHKGLLSDMPMNIVKVDIAGKGTYYRLYVGEFPGKDRVSNLCAKLKKQKQDCVPAK